MIKVWMQAIIFERWLLIIIGISLAGEYNIINLPFNGMLWGLITIGVIALIRIIVKGVWLNGKAE